MSIEQGPNSVKTSAPSGWEDVAALAGHMGELGNDTESSIEARQKEAIDLLAQGFLDEDLDEEKSARLIQEFTAKSKNLWSHDYALAIMDKFSEMDGETYDASDAWELVEFGMPLDLILDDEDFYQGMLGSNRPLPLGMIIQISHTLSTSEEGHKQFQHDFIESGKYAFGLRDALSEIYKTGECNEVILSDLSALKELGIGVFDAGLELSAYYAYEEDETDTQIRAEGIRTTTDFLIQNGLIDGKDYDQVVDLIIDSNDPARSGILDAMLASGLEAESDNEDTNYWINTSRQTGQNMLGKFITSDAKELQAGFDFTAEPVMRAFARHHSHEYSTYSVREYQDPQFREALKNPTFQDIILKTLEETCQDMPEYERMRFCPSLFLMLAEDRSVLASLRDRDAFKDCPTLSELDSISTVTQGDYTERDRLSLFLEGRHTKPEFFDQAGEPNWRFYHDLRQASGKQYYLDPAEQNELKLTSFWEDALFAFEKKDYSQLDPAVKDYFFDASGPKPGFWQRCLVTKHFALLCDQKPEVRANMGLDDASLALINSYYSLHTSKIIAKNEVDDILKYFDASGPTPEFWHASFEKGDLVTITRQPRDTIEKAHFDEKRKKALEVYKQMPDSIRGIFSDFITHDIDSLPIDRIEIVGDVLNQLRMSNAEELATHVGDFAKAILSSNLGDNDKIMEALNKIEDVFLHNNLPYFGKVFKTFRILYPGGVEHQASEGMDRGALKGRSEISDASELPPRTISEFKDIIGSKDAIIFGDLLKATMGSNNRDLKNYIHGLMSGAHLTERVLSGETEFSEAEQETLRVYSEHLKAIFENTQAGKSDPIELTVDTIEDIKLLTAGLSPTSRYSVPDRIVRSFGFMIGVRSCQDMLARMDRMTTEADARNRAAAARGVFRLESGDLIKSTSIEYLGAILQNGSVSKEFLNGQQSSDSTPLDTDLNVLPEGLSGDVSEGVDTKNRIAAFGSMHCMMVMKGDASSGRSRFMSENKDGRYDPNRYEIWHNGGDNYGIRVGFPSTEIDYFIWDDLGKTDSYGDLERMKHEIVKNGFYIPIVDKTSGQLIFTPEEYDEARKRMSGLESLDGGPFLPADSPERGLVPTLELGSYTLPDGTTIESTAETIAESKNNQIEVDRKRGAILESVFTPVLAQFGLTMKDYLDGDLTEGSAEVIDTGSTGRYSNAPGDGDFDFMMKLDRRIIENPNSRAQILDAFCDVLGLDTPEKRADAIKSGNFRTKHVMLPGLDEPVDIDITFATKTNKVQYSTDVALGEFYDSMPPDKREEVAANVVFAKRFLKAIGAYKPDRGDNPEGGLGGVGIENWILQNGGSFLAAAREFMRIADECGDNFEAFRGKYAIFDYGQNHQGGGNDNFVTRNMSQSGYDKMRTALQRFLDTIS